MNYFFGKKKTPAELLHKSKRDNKRTVDKSIREIDGERQGLKTQEKKIIVEIKKLTKQGRMGAVKVKAKDLIHTRHQITKFSALISLLQRLSLRIQTQKSMQAIGETMKVLTKVMSEMNLQMIRQMNGKMKWPRKRQTIEMSDGDEEEIEELVGQVLVEITIDTNKQLVGAPNSNEVKAESAASEVAESEGGGSCEKSIDDDLQARFDNLRKI